MSSLNDFNYTDDLDDVLAIYVNNLLGSTMRSEYKNVETLSADRTLTDADTPIQRLNCNGAARIVLMPTEDAVSNHPFFIVNSSAGAYAITVKSNDGTTTLATVEQGESVLLISNGAGGYLVPVPASTLTVSEVETDLSIESKYKITPTVASNNLILTLTHMDGTTPSASRPLWMRIGNTMRSVQAALSVQVNASVSTFGAGASELATKEIDCFAYVGWRTASSAVVIGISRIPYANLYSDFSSTATDKNYAAFSTAPAATDEVVVIGRFAATLSAVGTGHLWTVPTFNSANLVNRQIFETRYLTFVPTHFAGGGSYTNLPTTNRALYKISMYDCFVDVAFTYHATSGGTTYSRLTAPYAPIADSLAIAALNATAGTSCQCQTNSGYLFIYKYDGTTPIVNSQQIGLNGKYRIV